ncbi:putative acetyltransferase [Variovorax sp. TBS-050B]|uniref:GNAT family N-acetyltransferase n=1 Tax=Variovorax sp. TBS-050B TaxID=2940551 RepID=UPI0024731103|nr:GNAT family N-acetyltransferase [Variovorax sp. TBS-050B]MDH6591183.1 putative acetyltransferase [Variovorax sp. TBS-050B]
MELRIRLDALEDPRIAAFLAQHLADMHRVSPPESVFALDLSELRRPGVRFWSGWITSGSGEALVAMAALKRLDAAHAELKSMRTAESVRGQGFAQRMLAHVLDEARAQGFERLSLETGNQLFFAPARGLYAKHGFEPCGPFGDYGPDPTSCFMTRLL